MTSSDLLIELGMEELPPGALPALSRALEEGLRERLDKAGLQATGWQRFATPRRLAVLARGLPAGQPGRESLRRGPALQAAFDADNRPTRAAEGFARSCGVDVGALEHLSNDKGSWLVHRSREPGQPTPALLPALLEETLAALPIPRRMRWGTVERQFVRPVHWLVMLFGEEVVPAEVMGLQAGRCTRGHRFHHPEAITLERPGDYLPALERGHVVADFAQRRERIREQAEALAAAAGGRVVIEPALLEEVTALVEWPVCIEGGFDVDFLALPAEVLIASMRDHQRYFHLVDGQGRLMNRFITVANIDSRDPAAVRAGNERVIRPRLSDARFFWEQDGRTALADRLAGLGEVVFQHGLGSVLDKTLRVAAGARDIAAALGADPHLAERAALLSRCDLSTAMVGEFPELQGIMGRYYALRDGENPAVAGAVQDFYAPRHAGEALPGAPLAQALAIADRLDTLVGLFAIGQPPTGDKDPFALRRAALGVLRLMIEAELDLDLAQLLRAARERLQERLEDGPPEAAGAETRVLEFMMERLRAYYGESGVAVTTFEAVLARAPTRPLDFDRRVRAVEAFRALPAAESLAAANKRIANILRKSGHPPPAAVTEALLSEPAERELAAEVARAEASLAPALRVRDYRAVLERLAELRPAVDGFFDHVLVMCEEEAVRNNRLALLSALQALFLEVADIARLQS